MARQHIPYKGYINGLLRMTNIQNLNTVHFFSSEEAILVSKEHLLLTSQFLISVAADCALLCHT